MCQCYFLFINSRQKICNTGKTNKPKKRNENSNNFMMQFSHKPMFLFLFLLHFFEMIKDDSKVIANDEPRSPRNWQYIFFKILNFKEIFHKIVIFLIMIHQSHQNRAEYKNPLNGKKQIFADLFIPVDIQQQNRNENKT